MKRIFNIFSGMLLSLLILPVGAQEQARKPIIMHFDNGKIEGKFGKAYWLGPGKDRNGVRADVAGNRLGGADFNKLTVELWINFNLKEYPKTGGGYNLFVGWWPPAFVVNLARPDYPIYLQIYGFLPLDKVVPASQVKTLVKTLDVGSSKLPDNWWQDGKWHHIAFGWDSEEGTVRLFFDGKIVGERKGCPFEIVTVPDGCVLGSIGSDDPHLQVDECRISFRLLDEAEIKKDFEATEPFNDK